jgi:hypothetical protein
MDACHHASNSGYKDASFVSVILAMWTSVVMPIILAIPISTTPHAYNTGNIDASVHIYITGCVDAFCPTYNAVNMMSHHGRNSLYILASHHLHIAGCIDTILSADNTDYMDKFLPLLLVMKM